MARCTRLHVWVVTATIALVGATASGVGASPLGEVPRGGVPADGKSPARCGPDDTPETGVQGDVPIADQRSGRAEQGYNCGLAVVGHSDLDGLSGFGMAWSGDCAYVQSFRAGGVKVVDVSDPTAPEVVGQLDTGGGAENLHAVTAKNRALLIAGRSGFQVDVFDVGNCTEPELLGTIQFALGTHNIELNPSATKVYTSLPLQEANIKVLDDPSTWKVRDFQCEVAEQAKPGATGLIPQTAFALERPECANMLAHEFGFNRAGTRMYIGGQLGSLLLSGFDPQHRDDLTEQEFRVLDITVWPPKVISTIEGSGHGSRWARIGGKEFVLHSNEMLGAGNGCQPERQQPVAGVAHPFLTDVSNERKPRTVSELKLAINSEEFCENQTASGVNSSVHWHEFDDPNDATFAMASMVNAGLRVFDVRTPKRPVEVAYFNPGQSGGADGLSFLDRALSHAHYQASTGHIWVVTGGGGFWVLELEPQVRKALGMPRKASEFPNGREARPPEFE